MRINRFIALCSDLSRRSAEQAIRDGRVTINGKMAELTADVSNTDIVQLDHKPLTPPNTTQTILLNKPAGYVVSHNGQGSQTIYDLLPKELTQLNPVGRLDKDSSGLLLLTNDGTLAHELTHPSFQKVKIYEVVLDSPLPPFQRQMISDVGLTLEDGVSQLQLERLHDTDDKAWRVTMHEGRNRQVRRTFAALGYMVVNLHRVQFGSYTLPADLQPGKFIHI